MIPPPITIMNATHKFEYCCKLCKYIWIIKFQHENVLHRFIPQRVKYFMILSAKFASLRKFEYREKQFHKESVTFTRQCWNEADICHRRDFPQHMPSSQVLRAKQLRSSAEEEASYWAPVISPRVSSASSVRQKRHVWIPAVLNDNVKLTGVTAQINKQPAHSLSSHKNLNEQLIYEKDFFFKSLIL